MPTPAASLPLLDASASDGPGLRGPFDLVEGALLGLDKAVRACQLYQGAGGSYLPFVDVVQQAFAALWQHGPDLVLAVEESRFLWEGTEVWKGDARRGLAALFHRDGIREVAFLPGFEEEAADLVALLAAAQRLRGDEDDLLTLLWERDFAFFRHHAVDALGEDVASVERPPTPIAPIDIGALRHELRSSEPTAPRSPSTALHSITSDHGYPFQDTLHFLEPAELHALGGELQREFGRDLHRDILLGLLDRLEDGTPERQRRILRILAEMLPELIGLGNPDLAVLLLAELSTITARQLVQSTDLAGEVRSILDRLGEADTVREMGSLLQDPAGADRVDSCLALIRFLPPAAVPPLMAAAEAAPADVRRRLWEVVEETAAVRPDGLLALLACPVPGLVAGAARLAGKLRLADAGAVLARLVRAGEVGVRIAAIQALQQLPPTASGGAALVGVLDDPDREVRLAALRAFAVLRHAPAREALEEVLASRRLREGDRTERIAAFEAYGAVAGSAGIPLLQAILHGRDWLRRAQPAELRACAAVGLGGIDDPRAVEALSAAARDADPVVRAAAARALKKGTA